MQRVAGERGDDRAESPLWMASSQRSTSLAVRMIARASEVDPHDDTSQRRTDDLGEAGVGEDALGADVQLLQKRVLRRHGIALDGVRAALSGEVHCGARECPADAALAGPDAGDEARHGPDAVVGLVLVATVPGNAEGAQQARVGGAGLDRAPADGLALEVGDEAAGRAGLTVAAAGLPPQPVGAILHCKRGEGLPRPQLVPLALAPGRSAPL